MDCFKSFKDSGNFVAKRISKVLVMVKMRDPSALGSVLTHFF